MFLFKNKCPAFEGIPYDLKAYYAGGMADKALEVRREVEQVFMAGGINGVKVEPWSIKMRRWFSESREYVVVRYEGVWVYLLVIPFGSDLYASWITFFKLGCLQRLVRFGQNYPGQLDVDDLEMVGKAADVYLSNVLDQTLRSAGIDEKTIQNVFQASKRKRFIKAGS